MQSTSQCSWCHKDVDIRLERCPHCGHDAHRARMFCGCKQCRPNQDLVRRAVLPVDD